MTGRPKENPGGVDDNEGEGEGNVTPPVDEVNPANEAGAVAAKGETEAEAAAAVVVVAAAAAAAEVVAVVVVAAAAAAEVVAESVIGVPVEFSFCSTSAPANESTSVAVDGAVEAMIEAEVIAISTASAVISRRTLGRAQSTEQKRAEKKEKRRA